MTLVWRRRCVPFLLYILLLVGSSLAMAENVLKVRADYWMPNNGKPDAEYPGAMVEILKAVFEPEGIAIDYALLPWERAVQGARIGQIDCLLGAYQIDVPDFVFPELPWGMDHAMFFVKRGDPWRFKGDVQALMNRRLGTVAGYSYGKAFDEFANRHKGEFVFFAGGHTPLLASIKKLKAGRLDTILDGVAAVRWQLKELNEPSLLEAAGEMLPPEPLYLACSPSKFSSERIVNLADKGILKLRASGQLKRILDRYGIPLW